MSRLVQVLTFSVFLLLPARQAVAQAVYLLPQVTGDAHIPEELQISAADAVARALTAEGLDVRTDVELPEALQSCSAGPCIAEVLALTGTPLAAGITLWARRGAADEAREIVVGLIDAEGNSFNGTAEIPSTGDAANDVRGPAREAAHQAHARFVVGPGPFLLVTGTPFGSSVFLDGEMVGGLPWNGRVDPGDHEIRVERQGFIAEVHQVQLADDITAHETLEIALAHVPTQSAPSIANWLIGGAGIAAGLALMIPAVVNFGLDGHCNESSGTGCTHRNRADPARDGVLLGVGGALIVGGIVFFAAQPIQVSASAGPDEASVSVSGVF